MDNKALANLLFPDVELSPDDIERKFPPRSLGEGACVTRIGPSPTGFVHLGNLFNAIIAERLAHQSGGVFYLRIEDTDNKREVEGAVETIINAMAYFDVIFDEGATRDGDKGNYGPYRQRMRRDIYHVFAKQLVENGKAYPCFLTAEELEEIRKEQTENKEVVTGLFGKYAEKSRSLTFEDIEERIKAGQPWVLRYKGEVTDKRFCIEDAIRGKLDMPRNIMDFVLLKSDGIPTYHFAHVIDDHLMRSTHVIRGEEWLSSLSMHIELFDVFGWEKPIYCHTSTLQKMDGESKRKLSKRKDPELALAYYQQVGFCKEAVWEFLLTVLNSNYEEWRIANPDASYTEFPFSLKKMSISGALFDLDKLSDISKDVICKMSPETVLERLRQWCGQYDPEFSELINKYPERTLKALGVGKNSDKPRKDLINWKQTRGFISFYYDETFTAKDEMPSEISEADRREFFKRYIDSYSHDDDSAAWFAKVKEIAESLGYAVKVKEYKKTPELFKGSIVHVTNMLRIALTGMANAPDIWEVSHVLGEELTLERLKKWV